MNNKPPFGFLFDINGDRCPKILMSIVVGVIWLALSMVAFFYALGHVIMTPGIVDSVLVSLGGYSAAVLGITVFQKVRGKDNNEKND